MLSTLFNLLLANITIISCFFVLFLVAFFNLVAFVHNENARLRLALDIPTGIPLTEVNDAIEILPLLLIKQLKISQNNQKKQYTC